MNSTILVWDPIGISAKNLMNLGDLLDDTVKHFHQLALM